MECVIKGMHCTLTNCGDPDEIWQNAAIHLSLQCLL